MGVAVLAIPKLIEILGPLAISAGANVVAQVLRTTGGKPGAIAADVIDAVSKKTGIPATPESLGREAVDNPGRLEEALRDVQRENAERLAAILAAEVEMAKFRTEIVKGEQASSSLMQRIWRPLNGVLFGLCCSAVVLTVCIVLLRSTPVRADVSPLLALIVPVITGWAGIVGFYAKLRTDEKVKAKQ